MVLPAIEPLIAENAASISALTDTVTQQQHRIDHLENEIDTMKQQGKRKTLIISGLKQDADENVESLVMKLCKDQLQVNLQPVDIDSVSRLKGKKAKVPSDIMLTVTTYRRKLEIVRAKKKLKDCDERIYINESLTPKQGELYADSRKLVKQKLIEATWTRDGTIYVKEKKDSNPVVIISHKYLNELKERKN